MHIVKLAVKKLKTELDVLFDEFDNGYGKFSRWDSFRADMKIDTCEIIYNGEKWVFKNVCK